MPRTRLSRRSICAAIAAIFGFGTKALAKSAVGLIGFFNDAREPEIDKRLVRSAPIYAQADEWVTCENGHVIAQFGRSVKWGDMFDASALRNWQQPKPEIGTYPIPRCERCGAQWCTGSQFHFDNGWRV